MMHPVVVFSIVAILITHASFAKAGRFGFRGPAVTVTLKPPASSERKDELLMDWSSLEPVAQVGIYTKQPPLPNWFPSLKSLSSNIVYRYNDLVRLPSTIDTTAKWEAPLPVSSSRSRGSKVLELELKTQHDIANQRNHVLVQIARGASNAMARIRLTKTSSQMQFRPVVEMVRASLRLSPTFLPHPQMSPTWISDVRINPQIDLLSKDVSCPIEAVLGLRTKAIWNVEYRDPTLAILYALDDYNLIRPEIHLWTGRMTYQWIRSLAGRRGGSIHVHVDPTDSIRCSWTDPAGGGGDDYSGGGGTGTWITDIRLPLERVRRLAIDVRVRRQFQF